MLLYRNNIPNLGGAFTKNEYGKFGKLIAIPKYGTGADYRTGNCLTRLAPTVYNRGDVHFFGQMRVAIIIRDAFVSAIKRFKTEKKIKHPPDKMSY